MNLHRARDTGVTLLLALVMSYVTTQTAAVLDIFFPWGSLYTYNKYLIALAAAVAIIKAVWSRSGRFKAPGIWAFAAFFAYCLLHGIYPGGDDWFFMAANFLKCYIVFLIVINLFRERQEFAVFGGVFVAVTIATLAIYYARLGPNVDASDRNAMTLEAGFALNANTVSYMSSICFLLYLYLVRDKTGILFLTTKVLLFLAIAIIASFNGSRVAMAFTLAVVLVEIALSPRRTYSLLLFLVALAVGYAVFPYIADIDALIARIAAIGQYQSENRYWLVAEALKSFQDGPLWGAGYEALFNPGVEVNHLEWLNVLVAYGLFGFSLFVGGLARITSLRITASRFSLMSVLFVIVFLFFAPIVPFVAVPLAIAYRDTHYDLRLPVSDEHMNNRKDRSKPLWTLICSEIWFRRHME